MKVLTEYARYTIQCNWIYARIQETEMNKLNWMQVKRMLSWLSFKEVQSGENLAKKI